MSLEEVELVAFTGEVVMRLALLNPIRGQMALGQQGIHADVLAFTVDGVEPGDSHLDFIGLLDGVGATREGLGSYFFNFHPPTQ